MKDKIQWVDKYRERGLNVLPSPKDRKGALVKNWTDYYVKKSTAEEHKEWFENNDHNVCLICGPTSNGLFAIDFDGQKGDPDSGFNLWEKIVPEKARKKFLETTTVVRTGNGVQLWARLVDAKGKPAKQPSTHKISDQPAMIEVLSGHRTIMAPPSSYPGTDKFYELLSTDKNLPILEICTTQSEKTMSLEQFKGMFQDWLKEADLADTIYTPPSHEAPKVDIPTIKGKDSEHPLNDPQTIPFGLPPCVIYALSHFPPEGERNDTFARLVAMLTDKKIRRCLNGMTQKDTDFALAHWNQSLPKPMDAKEFEDTYKSMKGRVYSCNKLRENRIFREGCNEQSCTLKVRKRSVIQDTKEQRDLLTLQAIVQNTEPGMEILEEADGNSNYRIKFTDLLTGNQKKKEVKPDELRKLPFSVIYRMCTNDFETEPYIAKLANDKWAQFMAHLHDGAQIIKVSYDPMEEMEAEALAFIQEREAIDDPDAAINDNQLCWDNNKASYWIDPKTVWEQLKNLGVVATNITRGQLTTHMIQKGYVNEAKPTRIGRVTRRVWWLNSNHCNLPQFQP